MASIEKHYSKSGSLSYYITISTGYATDGRKMRRKVTFIPESGMTEKQADKAALQRAVIFEQKYGQGYELENTWIFHRYAEYVLNLKKQNGLKLSTYERYVSLLVRINETIGNMKLKDIRPIHLNNFYTDLSKAGVREIDTKSRTILPLETILTERHLSKAAFARACMISGSTVSAACQGHAVRLPIAQKMAQVLGLEYSDLFHSDRNTQPLATKTILEYHRLISTILGQAEKEMLVPYNAAQKASPPKVQKKTVNYFQPEEICTILEALQSEPIKWRTLTHMLIITGARRGEIAGLKWSKIDYEKKRIRIDTAVLSSSQMGVYETTTKTGNCRYVPLPVQTLTLLEQYHRYQRHLQDISGDRWYVSDFIFTRDNGHPMDPDTITAWLNDFSRRKNLPHINPHAFRHSAASILIAKGTDIVTVANLLGHASVTTTENIYAHVIEESKTTAGNLLADTYFNHQK